MKTYEGKECIHGHGTTRSVATKACIICTRIKSREHRQKYKEKYAEYQREYRKKNPEYAEKAKEQSRKRNKERWDNDPEYREYLLKWGRDHRNSPDHERYLERNRKRYQINKLDPEWKEKQRRWRQKCYWKKKGFDNCYSLAEAKARGYRKK